MYPAPPAIYTNKNIIKLEPHSRIKLSRKKNPDIKNRSEKSHWPCQNALPYRKPQIDQAGYGAANLNPICYSPVCEKIHKITGQEFKEDS
jgi:hypothetical protein